MDHHEKYINDALDASLYFLKDSPWRDPYYEIVRQMRANFNVPCVLTIAVAGRVKAGKSTLINALLGVDLAKTGIMPTTATINSFYYLQGELENPEKPIRCIYRSEDQTIIDNAYSDDSAAHSEEEHKSEWISQQELDAMQTDDSESLQKTLRIKELRYYLPLEQLREMNLVDTPGTRALISEHTDQTADFFGIYDTEEKRRLANERLQQNNLDTALYASRADAILFVSGNVPLDSMKAFLDEFKKETGARNAIGLISQIDSSEDTLRDREILAENMARHLQNELNTAIPVSAALARALQIHVPSGRLQEIADNVKKFDADSLAIALEFCEDWQNASHCPIPPQKRRELAEGMPYEVFVLIAKQLFDHPYEQALKNLWDISGIPKLQELLREHFLKRKRILRCYKVIHQLIRIFNEIKNQRLMEYQFRNTSERSEFGDSTRKIEKTRKCLNDALAILLKNQTNSLFGTLSKKINSACENIIEVNAVFERMHEKYLRPDDTARWDARITDVLLLLEKIKIEKLNIYNIRFEGLLAVSAERNLFQHEEIQELLALFGCYANNDVFEIPNDLSSLIRKKQIWMVKQQQALPGSTRKNVAGLAIMCYNFLIEKDAVE